MGRGFVLILLVLTTIATRPNETPNLIGGGSVGYVRLSIPKTPNGVIGLPPQSNPYPATLGFGWDLHIGATLPLATQWNVGVQLGYRQNTFTFQTTEPTVFNINGNPTPGTFTHNLDFSWSSVVTRATVGFLPSARIGISLGLDAEFPTSMTGTSTETISDPDGVTYTNGDSSRIRADGDEASQTSFAVTARIHTNITLSDHTSLQPFIAIRQQLSSLSPNADLLPTSLSIGTDIAFSLLKTQPVPVDTAVTTTLLDTTVVDTGAKPFLATVLNVQLVGASQTPSSTVKVFTKRRLVLVSSPLTEREVSATGDIGIEPQRRMVDTVIDADPPRLVVRSKTIADGGFRTAVVRAKIKDAIVWSESWNQAPDTTLTWELRNLSGEHLTADTLRMEVSATAFDNAQGSSEAIPKHVVLTRDLVSTSSSKTPDYIDATFAADAFVDNALSLSGKGLVTALQPFLRNAKSVAMTGSKELIARVKDACGISTSMEIQTDTETVRVVITTR